MDPSGESGKTQTCTRESFNASFIGFPNVALMGGGALYDLGVYLIEVLSYFTDQKLTGIETNRYPKYLRKQEWMKRQPEPAVQ